MKEKLVVLIDLQTLETEAGRVQSTLNNTPGEMEALDDKLLEFKTKLSEETDKIADLKKEYRSGEADVEMNMSRIQKSKERMDTVKTNKEYQSLQKEIQDLEAKNSLIEDEMLLALDRIEAGESRIARLKDEESQLEKEVAAQKILISQKAEEGKRRLLELKEQQEALDKTVDPEILKTYNSVKARVQGAALVPVNDAVCQGCHLMIPPQMYNELQRWESLKFCPHCHRIIYWSGQ